MSDPQRTMPDPEKGVMRNHAERSSDQAAEKWHRDSKRLSEKHGVMLKRRGSKAQLQTGSNPRQRKCKGSAQLIRIAVPN